MTQTSKHHLSSWIARGVGYFAFWVLLIGVKPVDLLVGLLAAAVATWSSIALLPPGALSLRMVGLPRFALHFLWQTAVAGVQVARLAFAPQMRLRPGLVSCRSRYPQGARRNAFASLTSLLPGTVPVQDDAQGLIYHVLDTGQPIADQLAEEETALYGVLPSERQA